jgi:tetratricopeptide (TPR) repeat protein
MFSSFPLIFAVALAPAQPAAGGWSSGRPPECTLEIGGSTANVWERAKSPELRRYCDLIASAASKLAGNAVMAPAALAAAREADGLLPGHAAPRVLEGRALAALGQLDAALAALREGKARDRAALDDPLALLAWARVLARTGHSGEAVEAYRALLPRTGALSTVERAAAAVEAGLATMAGGTAGVDDAVAALREALRDAQDDALGVAILALALALDRRGEVGEARALLADRAGGDPRNVLASSRAKELLAVAPVETPALAGLALEPNDVAGARDAWEQYLAGLSTATARPWESHARAHLDALPSPLPGGHASARRPR